MPENTDDLEDVEDLGAAAELTPKENLFCEAFANPESRTYGNATKSAQAAGYSQPHNAGWKLRRRSQIRARLGELYEVSAAALGRVMTDLEHERQLAVAKGDIASAVRASELMGKRLGAFLERNIFALGDHEIHKLTETEEAEARRLAGLLVELELNQAALPPPQGEAELAQEHAEPRAALAPTDPDGSVAVRAARVDSARQNGP